MYCKSSNTKPIGDLHNLFPLRCWSKKRKICNLRLLKGANYMSYSFQKTYQIIQNLSPECFSGLFKFSFTERLQDQGH